MNTILKIILIIAFEIILTTAGLDDFAELEERRVREFEITIQQVVFQVETVNRFFAG
jgi:hypothetical protein